MKPGVQASPARPLLQVQALAKALPGPQGRRRIVLEDVSFQLDARQTLGVVGETGVGVLGHILIGLASADHGQVWLEGRDWLAASVEPGSQRQQGIQAVLHAPSACFDLRHSVWRVLGQALAQAGVPRQLRRPEGIALLEQVQLPAAVLDRRPLELPGEQRQRLVIARALALRPRVLVADTTSSNLERTAQARLLALLAQLTRDHALACVFIAHEPGALEPVSDRIVTLKGGRVLAACTGPVAAGPAPWQGLLHP
ncbi:ATP-binding cassette domain-containing protein [Enterobacterales bacterium AW_CKDN230030176-1A_HGKHYDSX7]